MSTDRETTRVVRSWLEEGVTALPDRVLDAVLDQVPSTPQRRSWWPAWRNSSMGTYAKLLGAAAAVLLVVVVGYQFLPGNGGVGGQPTIAPSPSTSSPAPSVSSAPSVSASPSAAPSDTAVYPAWYTGDREGAGILSAGSQTTRNFWPGFTLTVSGGWVNSGDTADYYTMFPDSPANAAEYAASGGLAHDMAVFPHSSPYFVCDAWEDNRGATAAEMVAAMAANEALATSEPVDVTVGGLTGKQVDLRLDPGWTETCPGDPPTFDLGDTRTRGIFLDSPDRGVIVIGLTSLHSADHEAFLAEAMPIIESFQFDIAQ